jgi:cell wall-associated NlpC family hydrolase
MLRLTTTIAVMALLACVPAAWADGGGAGYPSASGGTAPGQVTPPADSPPPQQQQPQQPESPPVSVPPPTAMPRLWNGRAIAPPGTPRAVRRVMVAANRLISKRYRWGGGHRDFARLDRGYDCSGAVSYALYGGRLLLSPLDSTGLARFGEPGPGSWITLYANRTHVYMVVAGLRFDTGGHDALTTPTGTGPRWSTTPRSSRRFRVRHPAGF